MQGKATGTRSCTAARSCRGKGIHMARARTGAYLQHRQTEGSQREPKGASGSQRLYVNIFENFEDATLVFETKGTKGRQRRTKGTEGRHKRHRFCEILVFFPAPGGEQGSPPLKKNKKHMILQKLAFQLGLPSKIWLAKLFFLSVSGFWISIHKKRPKP